MIYVLQLSLWPEPAHTTSIHTDTDLTIYSSFQWKWNAYFTRTYILSKTLFHTSLCKCCFEEAAIVCKNTDLSAPRFHYFSLFTDVCTAVEHFLYQEGPLWYILPAWVQFTYCNGERYSLLVSLMDSSVTNQIFTQALPGMSAQIIPCHPQYSHPEFWSVLLRVNAQVAASSETCVVLSSFWLCTWSVGTWLCGKSKWVAFVPLLSLHCFKWSAEVCLNLRNMLRWFDLIK